MIIKIYFVIFLLVFYQFEFNNALLSDDKKSSTYQQKITKIKSLMHTYNEFGEASVFGVINVENGNTNWIVDGNINLHTYLRYGSINNMFLSYLIVNKFHINKHICYHGGFEHINGYNHGTDLLIKHLLSHTSGISDYTDFVDYNQETKKHKIYDTINLGWKNRPNKFNPGEYFCWSNTNYELVAWLLTDNEKKNLNSIFNKQFGHVAPSLTIENEILTKLNFPNTTFYNEWKYNTYTISHAGNLIGTPIDLVNAFKSILMNRKSILIMNQWNRLNTCYEKKQSIMSNTYGLGLVYYENIGNIPGPYIGHDSNLNAKTILLFHIPSKLIIFFHSTQPMDYKLFEFYLQNLLEIWLFNNVK